MSTRELAYSIFEQLNEEQLEGFIAMFGKFYLHANEQSQSALQVLESIIKPVPDLDYDKELAEYREGKYCK